MAISKEIGADMLGIDEEMKSFKVEIYLRGGRLAATFTKEGTTPTLVLASLNTDKTWLFVQTDSQNETVIIRISEIEAIKTVVRL